MSEPKKWRLWRILKARGMTIEELGKAIGYSRGHLQRVKSGDRAPTRALKIVIADVLNVDSSILFEEED